MRSMKVRTGNCQSRGENVVQFPENVCTRKMPYTIDVLAFRELLYTIQTPLSTSTAMQHPMLFVHRSGIQVNEDIQFRWTYCIIPMTHGAPDCTSPEATSLVRAEFGAVRCMSVGVVLPSSSSRACRLRPFLET